MNDVRLKKVEELIKIKKINEAQLELSKLGEEFNKNSDYLYLRGQNFLYKRIILSCYRYITNCLAI